MKDFDVIVVGAGLGGLSAATFLSQPGKRVLRLEKHNVPGGYASSLLWGRFEFDVALHELSGVYTPVLASAVVLFLAIIMEFRGSGFLLIGIFGLFSVMGIPAVNSISQDVVSPAHGRVCYDVLAAYGHPLPWGPFPTPWERRRGAQGAHDDPVHPGAGIVASMCFWGESRHYPTDMEKVQGFMLKPSDEISRRH